MSFPRTLLNWYDANHRDLPWRQTRDPYRVWLSEVILQQTRIDQGLPYYKRFLDAFPTIASLACAEEQAVLKLWQGLGYYSRARNMHEAARKVVNDHEGVFPDSFAAIRQLKGVGEYTAAAVASICFGQPVAVVDGNVIRFLSRYAGIAEDASRPAGRNRIREFAQAQLDPLRPGDYNQALMEFGALVCRPVSPECDTCPFLSECYARRLGMVAELPVKKPKPAVRSRFLHYLVITFKEGDERFICLKKRTGRDIWKNLFDFPCVEQVDGTDLKALKNNDFTELFPDIDTPFRDVSGEFSHQLSHQSLRARFYLYVSTKRPDGNWEAVSERRLAEYPLPRLIERYLAAVVPSLP